MSSFHQTLDENSDGSGTEKVGLGRLWDIPKLKLSGMHVFGIERVEFGPVLKIWVARILQNRV